MAVGIPHFAVPFTVTDGQVQVVEQDSEAEVASCVMAILDTEVGSRIEDPSFGIEDQLFQQVTADPDIDDVLSAVETFEPRAETLSSTTLEDAALTIQIGYAGGNE